MPKVRPPGPDAPGPDPGDPPPGGAVMPQTGLRAYRNGTGVIRIPPLWIQNGALGAPDTLTVAFGTGASGALTDAGLAVDIATDQPLSPVTVLGGQTIQFLTDEFMLLIDSTGQANGDRGCTMFRVTGTDAVNNILLHASATSIWNPSANLAGMIPFKYRGGAGAGDVEQAGCLQPDAIRITLIARSLTPDSTMSGVPNNGKPVAEDGAAGAVDQYRHRVATVSLHPWN